MAGGDDEIRLNVSGEGDLPDFLARIEQRLNSLEDRFGEAGSAGREAGDDISGGADKAAESMRRAERAADSMARSVDGVGDQAEDAAKGLRDAERAAESLAEGLGDVGREGRSAASGLDDVGDDAAKAAAGLRGAERGAEAAAEALGDTAKQARAAGRALDDAGDEAAEAGAQAAASATWWERLAARIDRGERVSRRWADTHNAMRWSSWSSGWTAMTARAKAFVDIDWDKAEKKLGKLSRTFGGFSKVMMAVKFGVIIGGVYALLGALSALGAGAVGAIGGLATMVPALGALATVGLVAKLAMIGLKGAMKESQPEVDALKKKFEGFSTNIAAGGLRKGLTQLTADLTPLSRMLNRVGTSIGEVSAEIMGGAGEYAKGARALNQFGVIADSVEDIYADLGWTVFNVSKIALAGFAASTPAAMRLSGDVGTLTTKWSDQAAALYDSGRMTEVVSQAYENLRRALSVVADWVVGLFRIFRIGAQESAWMGDSIEASAQRFRDWTGSLEGQNAIRDYFVNAMPAVREAGLLVRDIFMGFGKLAAGQDLAPLLNQIRVELLPALITLAAQFNSQLLPGLIEVATKLATMFAGLDFSGLQILLDLLNMFLGAIIWAQANIPGFNFALSTLLTTLFLLGPAFKVAQLGVAAFSQLGTVLGWIGKLPGISTLVMNFRVFWSLIGGFPGLLMKVGGLLITTAQWIGRGLAMAFLGSNPIGWIILAVIALVGIFWWLWENCAWFREGVKAVLSAVGGFFVQLWNWAWPVLQGIGGFFVWLWGIAVAAFNGIVAAAVWFWFNVLGPIFSFLWTAIKVIGAIIFVVLVAPFLIAFNLIAAAATWFYNSVIVPVFNALGAFFGWVFNAIIMPIVNFFVAAWRGLCIQVQLFYYMIIVPVLAALGAFFGWIFNNVIMPVINFFIGLWHMACAAVAWAYYSVVLPALAALGAFFGWIFNSVIMPVVNFFVWLWNTSCLAIQIAYYTYIQPVLQFFASVLNWLWLNVATPVINGILFLWNMLQAGIAWVYYNLIQPVFSAIGAGLDVLRGWFQAAVDGIANIWNGLRRATAVPVNFLINTVWNNGILKAWNWVAEKIGLPVGLPIAPIPEFATGGGIRGKGTGTSDDIPIMASNNEHMWTAQEVRGAGGHKKVEQYRRLAKYGALPDIARYASGGPVTPQEMTAVAAGAVPGTRMSSGYREGDPGWHGKNRAADLVGNLGAINHFIGTKFPGSSELIYTPGINIKNGRPHSYNAAVKADHYDHVHWANNGAGEGAGGGGGLGQTLWQIGKGILDSILDPIINGIPFHGPPQFLDAPKRLAITGKDMFYKWAEEKLSAIFVGGGGGDAIPGSGPVFDQVSAVAERWGWGPRSNPAQWGALARLIQKESSWNPNAQNPTSTAYGLFQFLNGTWGTVGGSKTNNPGQQTEYGLRYIKNKYRDPAGALNFHNRNNWYDNGGWLPEGPSLVMNGTGGPEPVFNGPQWGILSSMVDGMAGMGGLYDTDHLVGLMEATPQTAAALAASAADRGARGQDMSMIADRLDDLTSVIAERPPPMAVHGDEVRRQVQAQWDEHERRQRSRRRYQYGGS